MSIAPTRRVGLSSPASAVEKTYAGRRDEEFVEMIDTNNSVSVRSDSDGNNAANYKFSKQESPEQAPVNTDAPVVNNTIEALAASGVYEDAPPTEAHSRVNVYSNNQSIIKDEELERTGHNYLKHFYEKNEPVAEVDKFI